MESQRKKILMIEDDRFLRKIYQDKLTRAGFDFVEATNGEEGMDKALSENPDLILLDLILPRKNGFDVLIDLKRSSQTKKIPVVIVSNLGQEVDMKRGFALGASDYLVKPDVTLSEVVEKVKEWILRTQ